MCWRWRWRRRALSPAVLHIFQPQRVLISAFHLLFRVLGGRGRHAVRPGVLAHGAGRQPFKQPAHDVAARLPCALIANIRLVRRLGGSDLGVIPSPAGTLASISCCRPAAAPARSPASPAGRKAVAISCCEGRRAIRGSARLPPCRRHWRSRALRPQRSHRDCRAFRGPTSTRCRLRPMPPAPAA